MPISPAYPSMLSPQEKFIGNGISRWILRTLPHHPRDSAQPRKSDAGEYSKKQEPLLLLQFRVFKWICKWTTQEVNVFDNWNSCWRRVTAKDWRKGIKKKLGGTLDLVWSWANEGFHSILTKPLGSIIIWVQGKEISFQNSVYAWGSCKCASAPCSIYKKKTHHASYKVGSQFPIVFEVSGHVERLLHFISALYPRSPKFTFSSRASAL